MSSRARPPHDAAADGEVTATPVPSVSAPPPGAGPSGEAWADTARTALETVVGLGVIGILRLRSEAPRLEAELTRRGLSPLASLSRSAGDAVDEVVRQLLRPPSFTAPPPPAGGDGRGSAGSAPPGGKGA